MKKVLFVIVALFAFSMQGVAQKGRIGLGIDAVGNGMISEDFAIGTSVKFQYSMTDLFRIVPFVSYFFTQPDGDQVPKIAAGLNLHTVFIKNGKFRPYLITGMSYTHLRENYYNWDYYYYNGNYYSLGNNEIGKEKFGGKAGLGFTYRTSYSMEFSFEAGFDTASKEFVGIGLVYNLN